MSEEKLVEIEAVLLHETQLACLILAGSRKAWLPKSQVEIVENSDGITAVMPEWLAIEKDLV